MKCYFHYRLCLFKTMREMVAIFENFFWFEAMINLYHYFWAKWGLLWDFFWRIHSFCWSYEVSVWFPNLIWGLQFPDESRFNIWLRPKPTRFAPRHPSQQSYQKILYLRIKSCNQGYTSTISIQKVNLWPWKVCIV